MTVPNPNAPPPAAPTPGAPAPAPASPAPGDPAAAPAALPADLAALVANPEAFKARLGDERKAERAKLLKDLGVEKVEDLRGILEAHRTAEEGRLGREKVLEGKLATATTQAARAEALEAAVRSLLEAEEAAIPEASRGVLDLAPAATDPVARLNWIAAAKGKGILGAAPTPAPATLSGGGGRTPPAPAPAPTGGKDPRNMTDAEWKEHRATWAHKHAGGTA